MNGKLVIVVPGEPVAWTHARPECVRRDGVSSLTHPEQAEFAANVREQAELAMKAEGRKRLRRCVAVTIRAFWEEISDEPLFGCTFNHRPRRPAYDRVSKAITEALRGIAYRDDAQIVRVSVEKLVAPPGFQGLVEVVVTSLHGEWS